ncbi:MAG TPA: histidine--tRNA ligase [Solirubrobacteraceae bacterium]|nr:histidine--tRNA ligase [Solirubrobacteraceae bacterium]
MSEKLQAPRGTYDVLPEAADARALLERAAQRVLEGAGYRRIETPTFEATDVFARGVGASTDIVQKEMYTFDDGGGRSVTLRPEGTAPICRAYVEHGFHKLPQPVKLWYLSSFFRKEKPQAGRFRQFWQIGAEALGSDDPAVDAEIILLLATLLEELEVGGLRLRVSSLGTPAARQAYREELAEHLRCNADRLSDDVRARIDLNPLRAFDSDHPGTRAVMAGAPLLLDRLDADDAEHFATVRSLLDGAGLDHEVDPTLVRGLDYYTRTVFEFTSDALGAQSGVAGGGRYDGLVEMLGGPATPGCGFAAGVERMLLAARELPAAPPPVDLFVSYDGAAGRATAFAVTAEARYARLNAQMELAGRSRKGQLKQADRLGARYVALLDDDGGAVLKDMSSGDQTDIAAAEVVARVLRDRGLR